MIHPELNMDTWQLDLPDGDFWEPMSTLKAFLFYHVKWKAERKHRKAGI